MIIGLLGNKNVGKDTLADYLVSYKKFQKYAFADSLKECLHSLFGFNQEQLNGSLKETIDEVWNITPREVLQFFGTEIMQLKIQELLPNINKNFFVKRFQQFLNNNKNKNIVISDVRFQHEINFIKEQGGIIIKINRDNSSKTFLNHVSESKIDYLSGVDFTIINNESVDNYFKKIDDIIVKY